MSETSVFIGICGGSGSGKSVLAQGIAQLFKPNAVSLISLDAYYWPKAQVPACIRGNYDHPLSLESELLVQHLAQWRRGETVEKPQYDFSRHDRHEYTKAVPAAPVMIVDGILLFAFPEVVRELDVSIFVDAPADIRLARRLERDMRERGRTAEDVLQHYLSTVRPMHEQYVEPSKYEADLVVSSILPFTEELATTQQVLQRKPALRPWLLK